MSSYRLPNFNVRENGFAFPNSFPAGSPVVEMPTPFGRWKFGDAGAGLCGGMVFAAMDYYLHGIEELPTAPGPALVRYFCKRLLDSWNLPFGAAKYYDWQRRRKGLMRKTIRNEWPRIRARLDAGFPAPLGIIHAEGYGWKGLSRNHQVLCYGYDFNGSNEDVTLAIYDPNYPGDETAGLTFKVSDPSSEQSAVHSCVGSTVRGIFLSAYTRPRDPPPVPDQINGGV